jgi:hypothetical protein
MNYMSRNYFSCFEVLVPVVLLATEWFSLRSGGIFVSLFTTLIPELIATHFLDAKRK